MDVDKAKTLVVGDKVCLTENRRCVEGIGKVVAVLKTRLHVVWNDYPGVDSIEFTHGDLMDLEKVED